MRDRLIPRRTAAHRVVFWAATLLLHAPVTHAQTGPSTAGAAVAADTLLETIAALDDRYFDAYNRCELEVLDGLHTDDLEAYHDLGGGPVGWETVREGLEGGACATPGRIRRELVPGTLSVYPIQGFGAIQLADHLFYEVQENGERRPVTAARLIVLWRRVDGDWKAARMISYDHQPADPEGARTSSADGPVAKGEADAASGPATVHVAPPTGVREADRASILAAVEGVRPGGTIQFAPGTYLVGEIIHVTAPRVTLRGHPEGTVLRGCDPEQFPQHPKETAELTNAVEQCNGLDMAGGHQRVLDLTFEYAWHALVLGGLECIEGRGCVPVLEPVGSRSGGYLVEGNTFRNLVNGIRTLGEWSEPAVVRGNRFLNTFHAAAVHGSTVHILGNEISVPEPEQVPTAAHPGVALVISATDSNAELSLRCVGNVIAGNRIEGHTDGVLIALLRRGTSCRDNVIRNNTIRTERVPVPASWAWVTLSRDSSVVGVPLALVGSAEGFSVLPVPSDESLPEGRLEGTIVEGNRILGAEGIGIEVYRASGTRIADNTITAIRQRNPFPGITLNSTDPEKAGWHQANGSAIWISPGSEENEIRGNTFEDIASHAVVLEGDHNRVELRSESDRIRDLGRGNQVAPNRDSPESP